MKNSGWIKLYRQIWNHWLWEERRKFSEFEAWVDMLMMANHNDKEIILGKEKVKVCRGQIVTSEIKLMERWHWSKTKLRTFIAKLQKDLIIDRKTDRKKTTINIVNYGIYQDSQTIEKPQNEPKKITQKIHKQEDKEIKKKDILAPQKKSAPEVKQIIDYYHEKFVIKFGEKPVIDGGKDGSTIKKLLSTYGLERLKGLIDLFLESEDPFILNSGYTIGVFKSQVNKLITTNKISKNPNKTNNFEGTIYE